MSKLEAMLHRAKIVFRFSCFILATLLAMTEMLRYFENSDTSVISFRRFNKEHGTDRYPSFTFCFEGYHFSEAIIDELHIRNKDFYHALKGENLVDNKSVKILDRVLSVEHTIFISELQEFLLGFAFKTKNENHSRYYDHEQDTKYREKRINAMFYINYHDPDQICFARKQDPGIGWDFSRKEDEILLDMSPFKYINGFFRIYQHYPQQFTRSMSKPIYELPTKDIKNTNHNVSWSLDYITILRKRPDASKTCNISLVNDDEEFKLRVIQAIGCIPSYWKALMQENVSPGMCQTKYELQEAYRQIKNFREYIAYAYDPPCVELLVPVNVEIEKREKLWGTPNTLRINVHYSSEIYQEIKNLRDFTEEAMWSSIGGFIGMFLGYSLLQIPDILILAWVSYRSKVAKIGRGAANVFRMIMEYLLCKGTYQSYTTMLFCFYLRPTFYILHL